MVVDSLSDADADLVFHALADATRRDIIVRAMRSEHSVSTLAQHYPMSFAAVQKHVAVLERARLITKQRRGREQIVHAEAATLRAAGRLLDAYEQIWRHRTDAIAAILAADEPGEGRLHQ